MGYALSFSNGSPGRAAPVDPFDGFFKNGSYGGPESGGLLDSLQARRWMDVVGWGSRTDLYRYQQPLASKSGPHVVLNGREFLMLSSYDYLGLIGHPRIEAAAADAVRRYGTGTGGVRLLTGTTELHRRFEHRLARWRRVEAAVTFSSGYLANIGVISALLGPRDRIVADSLVHRSIIEGARLGRIPMTRFEHNDAEALEAALERSPSEGRTLIIVEGIYSMDGDLCPLPQIVELKNRYGAYLMVDEAHSVGVLGSEGRGVIEHYDLDPGCVELSIGTLSKAIPSNGGFLAGSRELVYYLQHGAAPYMFSAALCPSAVAAASESLSVIQSEPERLATLRRNASYLRDGLRGLGFNTGSSESPIVPVILGADESAYRISHRLFDEGIIASPVVFPAVAKGAARLRLCATAGHTQAMLDRALEVFAMIARKERAA